MHDYQMRRTHWYDRNHRTAGSYDTSYRCQPGLQWPHTLPYSYHRDYIHSPDYRRMPHWHGFQGVSPEGSDGSDMLTHGRYRCSVDSHSYSHSGCLSERWHRYYLIPRSEGSNKARLSQSGCHLRSSPPKESPGTVSSGHPSSDRVLIHSDGLPHPDDPLVSAWSRYQKRFGSYPTSHSRSQLRTAPPSWSESYNLQPQD